MSCREAGHCQPCRQAGEEASPDPGDSHDRSTAEPIHHRQPSAITVRRVLRERLPMSRRALVPARVAALAGGGRMCRGKRGPGARTGAMLDVCRA
jgi:hypothetical protein